MGSGSPAAARAGAGPPQEQKKVSQKARTSRFLLFGTVFTEQGFALPAAEIAVRRSGEKKVHWRARSDISGEFVVRVPEGTEYELTVAAKGYQEQARKVDARTGDRADFVFRLQPAAKGEKKK